MPQMSRKPASRSRIASASRKRRLRLTLSLSLLIWIAVMAAPSLAQDQAPNQDQALVEAVKRFLLNQASEDADEVRVKVFPPSAQFGACSSPRPFFPNRHQRQWGRVSVGVECSGSQDRYLQAEIEGIGSYVTAAERMETGTVIDQGMLIMRQGSLGRLPSGTIRHIDEAIGKMTRRTVSAGSTLREHQLRNIPLVEQRQSVSVEAQGGGFRVSREGEALEDGGMGDEVRIRLSRREIITGEVIGSGRVAVDF